jgi:hypothetical protein
LTAAPPIPDGAASVTKGVAAEVDDGGVMATRRRFSETVRLPRRFLLPWVVFDCVYAAFLVWLWSVATMRGGQRVGTGLFLLATLTFLFGGAFWFVASHVEVDDDELRRRIGHRRWRVPLSAIAISRVEHTSQSGLDQIVLTLSDGSVEKVLTRRADSMTAALRTPRSA